MYRSTRKWTTAVAAAALMALPLAASAQQPPPTQPTTQQPPPAQPTTQQPQPAQPTTQQPAPASAAGQLDPAAAKTHLSAARDTLSQLTSLPEAAKLQGDARTQVSQVISNFNELITTQSDWRSAYAKVDANLTALLGSEMPDAAVTGVTGAVGTAGTAGAPPAPAPGPTGIQLEPAVRGKLVEFRKHLKEFEKAAGGPAPAAAPKSAPLEPAPNAAPPTGATGTSGMMPPPAAAATPMDQTTKGRAAEQMGHSEADKHLDAISAILAKSKTGTLTRAQTTELKKHVAELRMLLKQGK
jgi:hypothetical protein